MVRELLNSTSNYKRSTLRDSYGTEFDAFWVIVCVSESYDDQLEDTEIVHRSGSSEALNEGWFSDKHFPVM